MIRKGKTEDAKKIAKIKIENWRKTYFNIFPDDFLEKLEIEKETKKCLTNLENKNVIVYEKEKEPIAYCYYGKSEECKYKEYEGEIFALYVKNDCQEHGIGTQLLQYAVQELARKNKKIILWCAKKNTRAISFYQRNGFTILGTETEKIGGINVEKVALGLCLDGEKKYQLKKSANYIENEDNIAIYTNPDLIFLKEEARNWFKEIIHQEKDNSIPQKFVNYLLTKEVIEAC